MPPLARPLLFASVLTAASWAFAAAPESAADPKPECPHDDAKTTDTSKSDAKPADTPDRPAAGNDSTAATPDAPPANNNAAAPVRDAAKPARPAAKQRPAWPPPPELIS